MNCKSNLKLDWGNRFLYRNLTSFLRKNIWGYLVQTRNGI